ncbi:MAG: ferrous iron transport protein A [Anaerolineae bacterium]|nr:ferrous iron transport protein A [Anaerolineae bacterium]
MMIPLNTLLQGQSGLIGNLDGGRRFVSRLAALGFTPGAAITMMRNYGHGPVIVAVRGAQIALGRGEASHVLVHPTEENDGAL